MTAFQNVACKGDSQTDYAAGFGVDGFDNWVAQLQRSLTDAGRKVKCRGFGVSGATSADLLGTMSDCFFYAQPDCVVLYIGVNDPGAPITTSQSQANIQALIKAAKYKAIGDGLGSGSTVADQTALPATGKLGDRYVVLSDTSTTGGIAGFDPEHHTTITGTIAADANSQKQTVWEYRYSIAGVLGWGRVAINTTTPLTNPVTGDAQGCTHVVVISTNYLNFTSGGDTPTVPYSTYANVRTAQQAAVTAENGHGATVTYADLYTLQKALIQAGTVPDFSAVAYDQTQSWHYTSNNQHHSAFGHSLVAQSCRTAVGAALA